MLTPKEQAKELFDTFLNCDVLMDRVNAKICALIAVHEIIKALRKDLPEIGKGKGYWQEVKKEIEKL